MIAELPHLEFEQMVALRSIIAVRDGQWLTGRGSTSHDLLEDWERYGWFEERGSPAPNCVLYKITAQGRLALEKAYFENSVDPRKSHTWSPAI